MVHCIGIIAVAVYSTVYTNSETWYTHNHESDSEKLSLNYCLAILTTVSILWFQ